MSVAALSVSQRDRNLVSVLHDMIVGHDKALRCVHDDAAARGADLALRRFRKKRRHKGSRPGGPHDVASGPGLPYCTSASRERTRKRRLPTVPTGHAQIRTVSSYEKLVSQPVRSPRVARRAICGGRQTLAGSTARSAMSKAAPQPRITRSAARASRTMSAVGCSTALRNVILRLGSALPLKAFARATSHFTMAILSGLLNFSALDDVAATPMLNLAHDVARSQGRGCLSGNSNQAGVEASRKTVRHAPACRRLILANPIGSFCSALKPKAPAGQPKNTRSGPFSYGRF